MKNILLTITFSFFLISVFSQSQVATKEEINEFYKTKTLIVINQNSMKQILYNRYIKEAVKKYWTLTEYDFISPQEFTAKMGDPKYSFLLMTEVNFQLEKTRAKYDFLSLVLGGKTKKVVEMPELCAVPLSYADVLGEKYAYKLGTLVKFTQNHVELIKNKPHLNNESILKHYNKNLADIQNKTLYIVKEELSIEVNSLNKIKKIYSGNVKIVSRDELSEIIKNEDENAIYLHKVGPEGKLSKARCWKLIIGAKDAKLYYFGYHMTSSKKPDGFLAKDFKKLQNK